MSWVDVMGLIFAGSDGRCSLASKRMLEKWIVALHVPIPEIRGLAPSSSRSA